MFINENRLNVLEQSAKDLLKKEMESFLFSDADNKPAGYVEPKK
jgi:Fe-S cluster biosynthesis and repair protein YggX